MPRLSMWKKRMFGLSDGIDHSRFVAVMTRIRCCAGDCCRATVCAWSVRGGILTGLLQATFRTGTAHIVLLGAVTNGDRSPERSPETSRPNAREKRGKL